MGFAERPHRVIRPAAGPSGPRSAAGPRPAGPVAVPRPARELYAPRGRALLEAVRRLDARLDPAAFAELTGIVRDEYANTFGDVPLGFVARCHLGPPYVDHRLSLLHEIIDHFAPGEPMPEPFSNARMLVRGGSYEYVEIYASGTILPVFADGTVVRP